MQLLFLVHDLDGERILVLLGAAQEPAGGQANLDRLVIPAQGFIWRDNGFPQFGGFFLVANIAEIGPQPAAASAEHVALAALRRSEEKLPSSFGIAGELFIRRVAFERAQVGHNQLAVGRSHGKRRHLRVRDSGEDVLENGRVRSSPAPVAGRQIRPAPAFGIPAVTGRARFLEQPLAS